MDAVSKMEQQARESFAKHESTLLWDYPDQEGREHAVRAWRWGSPGTGYMASTIYVVPGRIIIAGDIADAVFERCTDMIGWALGSVASPNYVLEKVPHAYQKTQFSQDAAKEILRDLRKEFVDEHGAPEAMDEHIAEIYENFDRWDRTTDEEYEWRHAAEEIYDLGLTGGEYPVAEEVSSNLCWAYWVLRTWLESAKPEPLAELPYDAR